VFIVSLIVLLIAITCSFAIESTKNELYRYYSESTAKEREKEFNSQLKFISSIIKFSIFSAIIFGLILLFTPSTEEGYKIWLVPKVVNSEQVDKILNTSNDLLDLANKKIQEELDKN
jgi:hypothetical protein